MGDFIDYSLSLDLTGLTLWDGTSETWNTVFFREDGVVISLEKCSDIEDAKEKASLHKACAFAMTDASDDATDASDDAWTFTMCEGRKTTQELTVAWTNVKEGEFDRLEYVAAVLCRSFIETFSIENSTIGPFRANFIAYPNAIRFGLKWSTSGEDLSELKQFTSDEDRPEPWSEPYASAVFLKGDNQEQCAEKLQRLHKERRIPLYFRCGDPCNDISMALLESDGTILHCGDGIEFLSHCTGGQEIFCVDTEVSDPELWDACDRCSPEFDDLLLCREIAKRLASIVEYRVLLLRRMLRLSK